MHLFCVLQTRPSLLPVAYLLFYHTKSLHTHHKFCSRCFLEDSSVENSRFTFCQQKWVFIGWSATRDWTLETEEVSGGWITQSAGGQRARMTLGDRPGTILPVTISLAVETKLEDGKEKL